MATLKRLAVQITYSVALEDIELSDDVKSQLIEIANFNGVIKTESMRCPDAREWLCDNIRERDSLGHKYEIIELHPD